MLQNTGSRYSSTLARLNQEAISCGLRIEETKKRTAEKEQLQVYLQVSSDTLDMMTAVLEELKPMIQDVTEYISERRLKALAGLRTALQISASIIPEATANIDIAIDGDELELITADNLDVNLLEGSGYKAIISVFLRMSLLGQQPNYLTNIFLDEPFSKVSSVKSQDVAARLPMLAKTIPITLIEHKHEMRQNPEGSIIYTFELSDGHETVITKEVVDEVNG